MEAVGFEDDPDQLQEIADDPTPTMERFDSARGTYVRCPAGSGAELWIQLNAVGKVVGCNPHFAGEGRLEAAVIETVSAAGRPMDGHCFGWAAPSDPANPYSGVHSLAAGLPNFAAIDESILVPPVVTLQMAAFALEIDYFPTEGAFVSSELGQTYGAQPGETVWVHAEKDELPQPTAVLSGVVLKSERLTNPVTGRDFQWLLVQTAAGTIDMTADLDTAPRRPVAGTVVAGTVWLSASVISPLPERRVGAVRLNAGD